MLSRHSKHTRIPKIPRFKIARPRRAHHVPNFIFWVLALPLHPLMRELSHKLGFIDFGRFLDGKGRQKFLLGTIHPNYTVEKIIEHLVENGYGHNAIAWPDRGEVASLRLTDGFRYQYHVRIFEDGEVRGHYEYTPEAHPLKHYRETDMEKRTAYFLTLLEGKIVPC